MFRTNLGTWESSVFGEHTHVKRNGPKLKKTAKHRPKSSRTELGTSGTTVVRTWL